MASGDDAEHVLRLTLVPLCRGDAQIKHNLGFIDHLMHLEAMAEDLAGFHIHDVQFPGRDHCAPGTGMIDFGLRLLAVFDAQRSRRWPQVPTMRELGYTDAVYTSPSGIGLHAVYDAAHVDVDRLPGGLGEAERHVGGQVQHAVHAGDGGAHGGAPKPIRRMRQSWDATMPRLQTGGKGEQCGAGGRVSG